MKLQPDTVNAPPRLRSGALSFLSLFTSAGTLLCCALPSLFVLFGLGRPLHLCFRRRRGSSPCPITKTGYLGLRACSSQAISSGFTLSRPDYAQTPGPAIRMSRQPAKSRAASAVLCCGHQRRSTPSVVSPRTCSGRFWSTSTRDVVYRFGIGNAGCFASLNRTPITDPSVGAIRSMSISPSFSAVMPSPHRMNTDRYPGRVGHKP
jgi:hypothetical protein